MMKNVLIVSAILVILATFASLLLLGGKVWNAVSCVENPIV